jgi:DNA-binding CsgD family transcriptional regulator/PAS domain-containing protein
MSTKVGLDHDRLVELIYDASESPLGFQEALQAIGHQVGAHGGHALILEDGVGLAEQHSYGQDERTFVAYEAWRAEDPRFAAGTERFGEVLSDVAVIDPASFERSSIYNEFLAEFDVRYTLFANVGAGPARTLGLALLRSKRAGAFEVEEAQRLARLLPHLSRAARLRRIVRSLHDACDELSQALDLVPTALAVITRSGKVLRANRAAEALLGRQDGVRTERGVLTASRPTESRALGVALGRAAALADAGAWRPARAELSPSVTLARRHGPPLSLVLFPLRPGSALRLDNPGAARVLAVFHDPAVVVRLDPSLIETLYGLTPTEAALASALAAGKTLAQFAEARGCSEETARTHMKRVLDKTGTGRQAELIRVLVTNAMAHLAR